MCFRYDIKACGKGMIKGIFLRHALKGQFLLHAVAYPKGMLSKGISLRHFGKA
jgi:hypothetical protein